ncbi:MAG: DUF1343 domain-containing protein [bacterium]
MKTRRDVLRWGLTVAGGLGAAAISRSAGWSAPSQRAPMTSGLEVFLRHGVEGVRGMRIGLLCNHTSLNGAGVHAIDLLLAAGQNLQALFCPEHGLKGRVIHGNIADSVDQATGLPVRSLHGEFRKPTPAMLADLDFVLIDLPSIGARFFTYESTMTLMMEACGEAGIPVWVLDRPNPIGGMLVQGPIAETAATSFLGRFPIPVRHGLTMGEFAWLAHDEFGSRCDLGVEPLEGWQRRDQWADTGWTWTPPSPSLWTPVAALTYPGICFFEATNLSKGGSTFHPYEVVAAPWLDAPAIADALNLAGTCPGVYLDATSYTPLKPNDGLYADQSCAAIWLQITDPLRADPVATAFQLLRAIADRHPTELTFKRPHFTLLAGSDTLLDTVLTTPDLAGLIDGWNQADQAFRQRCAPYLLYS